MEEEAPKPSGGDSLNRLVGGLTMDERHDLLDKLKGHSTLSGEPLYDEEKEERSQENFEEKYVRLPWYYHIFYLIVSFFKARPPAKIYEDDQISQLGREIDSIAPGFYDYQKNFLCAEFHQSMAELKEGAHFFFNALDYSVSRDRGAFYAFLGSLEMPDVHNRLAVETMPQFILEKMPNATDAEMKQQALKTMEDAFNAMTEAHRNTMYHNARSLNCLKQLSAFLFDRVLMAFGSPAGGLSCSANLVKDMLVSLNNILFSLRAPPNLTLLESLFVFLLSERTSEKDFDMAREMRTLLTKAENAIITIRTFNKEVPLTKILRCACRDMGLSPKTISGGEDWFQVYREHWRRLIDNTYNDYTTRRKHDELVDSFRHFLKGANMKVLENVSINPDSDSSGPPVNEAFALSFLLTFYAVVFTNDINLSIRPILVEGEFFKRENRNVFTECYNDLLKIEEDIKRFDKSISPKGDLGKRYHTAKQDVSSLPVKRRKIQMVVEDTSREALAIIDRSRKAMQTLIDVLNGVLKRDPTGKYDTLGNFSQLAGKTTVFADGINDSIGKLKTALDILVNINALGGSA